MLKTNKEKYKVPYAVESIERGLSFEEQILGTMFNDQELIDYFGFMETFSKKVSSIGYELKKHLRRSFDKVQVLKSAHFSALYDACLVLVFNGDQVAYLHFHTPDYHRLFRFNHAGKKAIHSLDLPFEVMAFTDVRADLGTTAHFYLINEPDYLEAIPGLAKVIESAFSSGDLEPLDGSLLEKFKHDMRVYFDDFDLVELGKPMRKASAITFPPYL